MVNDEYPRLPDDLPEPKDDGGADHLPGRPVPPVELTATNGDTVDLSVYSGRVVVYCFPKMGRTADEPDPDGWEAIPGAYGCTQESCGFRDHYRELLGLDVKAVFGLSLQSRDHQREARERIHPPYQFLSDVDRRFTDRLNLPTFKVEGETYTKRLTIVLSDGRIEHVFYPVFPPDAHAEEVVRWLESHSAN